MLNVTSVKAGAHYMRPSTLVQSLQPDSLMMLSSAFDTQITDVTSSAASNRVEANPNLGFMDHKG